MILVMAGTSDGKQLAVALRDQGFSVIVTVTSPYGEALALEEGLQVHTGPLDVSGLLALLKTDEIRLLVDATHPYAVEASKTAMAAAEQMKIPYLRYERPVSAAEDPFIKSFSSIESLCSAIENEPGKILLTLGSNLLQPFSLLKNRDDMYIRILPVPALIEKCLELGFRSDHILAMQGPFSEGFNEALIRQWHITVLVTKDSAGPGGFFEKLESARNTGICLYLLNRPDICYTEVYTSQPALMKRITELIPHN